EAHVQTTGRASAGGRRVQVRDRLFVLVSLMLALLIMTPFLADGMQVNSATAKSNESGSGNSILGGLPTRVTWEGQVGSDEQVSSITLDFPQHCQFNKATVRVTALNGLQRINTDVDTSFTDDSLVISFAQPVSAGLTVRVEIQDICLPPEGGDVQISGSYTQTSGATGELAASPAISVQKVTTTERIVNALDNAAWCQAWNSNRFLSTFLKPQLIVSSIPSLFFGWLRALGLVAIGFPLAIPIGLCFTFLKISKSRIAHFFAAIYVNVIRGTPLFLQIYIAFFGLPLMGIQANNYVLGVIVLAINSSAYLCEIFRAGIQSIQRGQFEAAASLGMTHGQTMFYVIIPQTVRRVIPTMTSEFILLYKDSSLLSAVGVMELMMFAKSITATTGNITPYIVAAGYYLVVTLPLIRLVNKIEARVARSDGSASRDAGDDNGKKEGTRTPRKAGREASNAGAAPQVAGATSGSGGNDALS
ncbi:MAG: amino acid ABC transporter permease, partial [Coriobacteriales bacterium]